MNDARVSLSLDQLERVEEAGAAHVADDRQVEQLRRAVAVNASARARGTCSTIRSRFMISMFFSAIAACTGWPPKVIPCVNDRRALEERLHHVVGRDTAPIDAYADDSPFAQVIRSGRMS